MLSDTSLTPTFELPRRPFIGEGSAEVGRDCHDFGYGMLSIRSLPDLISRIESYASKTPALAALRSSETARDICESLTVDHIWTEATVWRVVEAYDGCGHVFEEAARMLRSRDPNQRGSCSGPITEAAARLLDLRNMLPVSARPAIDDQIDALAALYSRAAAAARVAHDDAYARFKDGLAPLERMVQAAWTEAIPAIAYGDIRKRQARGMLADGANLGALAKRREQELRTGLALVTAKLG